MSHFLLPCAPWQDVFAGRCDVVDKVPSRAANRSPGARAEVRYDSVTAAVEAIDACGSWC